MSKTKEIHEIYVKCKEIFEPSVSLLDEIENIPDKEEKLFYELLTNHFLKQKQKKIVENRVF